MVEEATNLSKTKIDSPAGASLAASIKDNLGRLIQIRLYEPADFDALQEMYDSFEPKGLECGLPPLDDEVRLRWVTYMVSELYNVLAVYRRRIVGHAALSLSKAPVCPEYLVFVRRGFRNSGIGTALSEVMKSAAQKAQCKKVMLTVRTANSRAIRVFKKVGFEFCDSIDNCRDMELRLRSSQGRKQSLK
jgi:RimJ/RimL family protein N-acetyltransferase